MGNCQNSTEPPLKHTKSADHGKNKSGCGNDNAMGLADTDTATLGKDGK